MKYIYTIVAVAVVFLQGCSVKHQKIVTDDDVASSLQVAARLEKGPGNITVTPGDEIIVSLHQFFGHETRVATIADGGALDPFAENASLNSVLGLQADPNGYVWLLDNAMRGGKTRRLVCWDPAKEMIMQDIPLNRVSMENSFLNDLAVDAEEGFVYIADPAGGEDAAIVVVDTTRGTARRVLQGHKSVIPEDMDLVIDGKPVIIRQPDGTEIRPRVGINPIALDADGTWLYYGPMHGESMYRIRTKHLRNASLSPEALATNVKRWADKPICDGISIDNLGNIYLGDLANNAIGVIGADQKYRILVSDPKLSWIDAFSFDSQGTLYAVANQLHRSKVLNGGESVVEPPFLIFSLKPFSAGVVGR